MSGFKIDQQKVMITFCRGKTVAKRGAYTVSSYIPTTTDASPAKHYLTTRQGTALSPLFPSITGRAIKQALRSSTGDQLLEQRSLRRGALQELAAQGMALTTLLLFSGHKTTEMLLRYLGHGGSGSEQRDDRRGESDVRMTQGPPAATPTMNKYVDPLVWLVNQ